MAPFLKIITVFSAFAILVSSASSPVCAANAEYTNQSTFWNWIAGQGGLVQDIVGLTCGSACPDSDDGHHHASSYEQDTGYGYYLCICNYCGDAFKAYEVDFKTAYNSQVADLPATGVTSDGDIILTIYPSYMFVKDSTSFSGTVYSSSANAVNPDSGDLTISFDENNWTVTVRADGGCSSYVDLGFIFKFSVPFNAHIKSESNITYQCYKNFSYQDLIVCPHSDYMPDGALVANEEYSFSFYWNYTSYDRPSVLTVVFQNPLVYVLTPFDSSSVSNTYSVTSRPASITGDYGIIGDNGQISNVGNTTIVNETNNTFTNPSTGTTSTITEWTYDYSDRSYNLTLDTGDTVTVTYGDENVTIQEGDTIYNVYYIINGSGEGTDPDACQHDYTSTVDREAACTVPGEKTYTCSLCGDTYTEAIPAKGHSWTVLQTVTTEYDEQGSLIRQGYTLYECSVCGEQYKDETGTGPPDSGGGAGPGEDGESVWDKLGQFLGTVFGGFIGFVEAFLGAVLDALISLATMIGEKTAAVVELILRLFTEIPLLFTGFLSFLSAVFPFFPEEIMLLLTFGIAVVVFIGIIKELRR